jgi:hypothetical protein
MILLTVVALSVLPFSCATELAVRPESDELKTPVVFGRVVALLTGQSRRWYGPEVRFFELVNRQTRERFTVDLQSDNQLFVLHLPVGEYQLTRVQISEGPFMSMAYFASTIEIGQDPVTYVGTWRFGVDGPRYGRMIVISAVQDHQDQAQAIEEVTEQFPDLDRQNIVTALPAPTEAESHLYEVMPYPRYPRYFRRHWW